MASRRCHTAVTPSTRQAPVGLAGDRWSLTVEGGLGSVDPNYVSFVVDPASLMIHGEVEYYPYPVDFTSSALKALDGSTKFTVPAEAIAFVVMDEIADGISGC